MKLGAVVGFNGEALRSLELKMSRRAGEIRSFGLNAKIGRDATLIGDLRGAFERTPGGLSREHRRRRVLPLHRRLRAHDRRADVAMAMEPPSTDNQTQQGVLNVRNFAVHDEAQLAARR